MKRPLPILVGCLWFMVCGLFFFFLPSATYHLPLTSSAFAQTQVPTIILPLTGTIQGENLKNQSSCWVRFDILVRPYPFITIPNGWQQPIAFRIPSFWAGTEVTFSLTLLPPCPEIIYYSTGASAQILYYPSELAWEVTFKNLANNPQEFFYFKVYLLSDPYQPPTPTPSPPAPQHPAIFIHGLGGRPEDWTTGDKKIYFDTLKEDLYNYPEDYLVAYPYADADGDTSTYDYQGDVTKISADLESYVNALSQKHIADGGDGKVDLVGFSLGGLVARQYLNTHSADHKIRKVITIATPHEGAYIFTPERWFDLIPFAGNYLKRAFNVFMENTVLAFVNFLDASGQPKDLDSPAIQQIVPGSNFLAILNSLFWTTPEPEYETLYGDIDAEFRQKIFFFTLKKRFSIGDGFIKAESATSIPAEIVGEYGYSDPAVLNIKTAKTISGAYEYVLDTPSISDLSAWHGRLVTRSDVVQKVIELLTAEN